MSTADQRLAEVMPAPRTPRANMPVEQVVIDGGTAYVSGQVAIVGPDDPLKGKVGAGVTVEQAAGEARKAASNGLYRLVAALGSLDAVERVYKLTVFVNGVDDLTEQPAVANGASALVLEILDERGRHARSAVGVASLPGGVPVEVEMIVKIADAHLSE